MRRWANTPGPSIPIPRPEDWGPFDCDCGIRLCEQCRLPPADLGVAPHYTWRQHPTEPLPFFVIDYSKWPEGEKLAWIRQEVGNDADLEEFSEKWRELCSGKFSCESSQRAACPKLYGAYIPPEEAQDYKTGSSLPPDELQGHSASSIRVLLSGAGSAAGHRRPGGGTRSDMAKRSTARRNASCVTTRSCAATARILRASGTIRRQNATVGNRSVSQGLGSATGLPGTTRTILKQCSTTARPGRGKVPDEFGNEAD